MDTPYFGWQAIQYPESTPHGCPTSPARSQARLLRRFMCPKTHHSLVVRTDDQRMVQSLGVARLEGTGGII
jgi:hypothetical protein